MYSCRNAIGTRRDLKPELVYRLYTAVVRPVFMYGVGMWWPALDKVTYKNKIEKVQRTACMLVSEALRPTLTRAVKVIVYFLPVDIFATCSRLSVEVS